MLVNISEHSYRIYKQIFYCHKYTICPVDLFQRILTHVYFFFFYNCTFKFRTKSVMLTSVQIEDVNHWKMWQKMLMFIRCWDIIANYLQEKAFTWPVTSQQ